MTMDDDKYDIPTSTLQRYELTEKFIKNLGISSKKHRSHRKSRQRANTSCQDTAALETFPHTKPIIDTGISIAAPSEPIPVPALYTPRAYEPSRSKESPPSSHSPKDIPATRKVNRKSSFTLSSNVGFNNGSFVLDKLATLETFLKRKKAESFRHFLNPRLTCSWDKSMENLTNLVNHVHYDPESVDDHECRKIPHLLSLVSPFQYSYHYQNNQPGTYTMHPLNVYKSGESKRELNDLFLQKHPEYEHLLKLSHIRSAKIKLLEVALELHIDISTVALSYAYFEKLFIKKVITKANRNDVAGACLLLAVKINDSKEIKLPTLLDSLERKFQVQKEDILKCEFWVFCSLEFGLVLAESEYWPHLNRLFQFLFESTDIKGYLGPLMYNVWSNGPSIGITHK